MNPSIAVNPPELVDSPRTSGFAIASLVCGLLFFVPFGFLLAIVFGVIALVKIGNSRGRLSGQPLAILGIVFGVGWVPFAGVMAAMAVPAFEKVREDALRATLENEARMIGSAAQQIMLEQHVESCAVEDALAFASHTLSDRFALGSDRRCELEGEFSLFDHNGDEVFFDSMGLFLRVEPAKL